MLKVKVQSDHFNVSEELNHILAQDSHLSIGGIGLFVGIVRNDRSDKKSLKFLTLEHYPAMTEKALERIAEEAIKRYELSSCTLIHRVGSLAVGEEIVLVAAASPHRGQALTATEFLIDWLKTKAPFWKRQDYEDGTSEWVEARHSDTQAADRW